MSALAALPAIAVAATDNKPFQVVLMGNPFPNVDPATVAATLLPMMQRAKPRPALTFTYERPAPPPSPGLPAGAGVRSGAQPQRRSGRAGEPARFRTGKPGVFYVYAIYCRNDRMLSYTTARTDASGPGDPRIERLFRELFLVVFKEGQSRWSELNDRFQ